MVDKDGIIIAGHCRREASIQLALKEVPVVVASHLSEEEVIAARIADNKVSEAPWNSEILKFDLNTLNLKEFKLEMTGFELPEIKGFLETGEVKKEMFGSLDRVSTEKSEEPAPVKAIKAVEGKTDENKIPDTAPIVTKSSQIFQLGDHRLMCADSSDIAQVEKLMNGEKADLVFTDPPYNIAENTIGMASSAPTNHQNEKLMNAEWDKGFDFDKIAPSIMHVLAEDATVYVCTSSFVAPKIWKWMEENLEWSSYCVWSKPNPFPSLMKRRWVLRSELICYGTRGKQIFHYPREGNATSVWTIPIGEGGLHPTQKPVRVPEHAIMHSSNTNQNVLDLFGGSGTTLIACEKTMRNCFMMEMNPEYCDVIIKRWEEFTGKKATLIS